MCWAGCTPVSARQEQGNGAGAGGDGDPEPWEQQVRRSRQMTPILGPFACELSGGSCFGFY